VQVAGGIVGVEAQLVGEAGPQALVRVDRGGLAAVAVQGQHQRTDEPVP